MAELIQPKQIDFTNFDVPITGAIDLRGNLTIDGTSTFRARSDDEYSLIVSGAMAVVDNYVTSSLDATIRNAVSASIFVQRVGTIGTTNPVGNTEYQLPGVIDLGGFF
jgi:hypothetical protein